MVTNTTINFRVSILEKVNDAAETLGISRSAVIIKLLEKVMNEKNFTARLGIAVQYQRIVPVEDSDALPDDDSWHKFHISFQENSYECFLDMRKLRKMSVSALVFYAVKEHLNSLLGLPQDDQIETDSYGFHHYVISSSEMHGVISWQLFWGLPEKMMELFERRLI